MTERETNAGPRSSCVKCGATLHDGRAGASCPQCLLDIALEQSGDETETPSWLDGVDDPGADRGRYEILDEIARGGMGVVYRARHRGLKRIVALKMILPQQLQSAAALERFRGEAEAVAAVDHPGILPIYEVGELDGLPFFSMKLAERGSLAQRHADYHGRLREAAALIARVALAVHHAHERGILHRDLKPGNILLGENEEAYVSDFGIAKWLGRDQRLTIDAASLGTPHYIAPEQASGVSANLTPAADVYSLGAILFELLTGQPPFLADSALETLRLAAQSPVPSLRKLNPAVPADLERICQKCLEKEPEGRYLSAVALADDLNRWLEGHTIAARPVTFLGRSWRWMKRNRSLTYLSLVFALALTTLAILNYRQGQVNSLPPLIANDSIAVIPFADGSPTHDQEYLCDGITEELLTSLTKVAGLRVVARSSSIAFKGKQVSSAEISQQLKVANLLEGSVRREGSRIHITAQLLDARSGYCRWSETYERELHDIAIIQREISRAVAGSFKLTLATTPLPDITRDEEAYDLYLRGLYFSNKSSESELRESLRYFQAALDKDPNFARAWSGIAKAWNWLADEYVKPLEAYPISKAAALKAISLDEKDAEAHAYLGEAIRVLGFDYQAKVTSRN